MTSTDSGAAEDQPPRPYAAELARLADLRATLDARHQARAQAARLAAARRLLHREEFPSDDDHTRQVFIALAREIVESAEHDRAQGRND